MSAEPPLLNEAREIRKLLKGIYNLMQIWTAVAIILALVSCCVWFVFIMPSTY